MRIRRTPLAALGFGLALLGLLLGMRVLSAGMTATHLRHHSERLLATLQSGEPLWHWAPRVPEDLIAGRAFGAASLTADHSGLRMTSVDGSPYQVGLRLAQPIDLAHWPLLVIQGRSSAPGKLGLIRQAAAEPACQAADAVRLPRGAFTLTLDLRALAWQPPCYPPSVADMLRLEPHMPAGATLQVQQIALRAPAMAPLLPFPAREVPADPGQLAGWIAPQRDGSATPLLRLPAHASAETLLGLRDRLRQHWPAALLVVGDRALEPAPAVRAAPAFLWATSALYLAGLLWLGLRPRQGRALGWLELGAILFGPLWLIAGLQWGSSDPQPAALAFAAALVYALRTPWRKSSPEWHWLGSWQSTWLALVPLPIALGLVALLGHHGRVPAPGAIAIYLLWAILQQWLMLAVVMRRLGALLPARNAVILLTATLFALMHTPNGALMQLCLLAECWWAWCFLRTRALLPIAVAHAACALLVQAGLVGTVLRSMEVSERFFL